MLKNLPVCIKIQVMKTFPQGKHFQSNVITCKLFLFEIHLFLFEYNSEIIVVPLFFQCKALQFTLLTNFEWIKTINMGWQFVKCYLL